MFYGVDHATGYIVNYVLRRKSEALAVFKRCVVDMAHKAGTAVKCVRGCLLYTSPSPRDGLLSRMPSSA